MSKQFDHTKIDEIVHSRIRLSILAALATADEIDFTTLMNEVNTTKGNLSVHLTKLENKGYVNIKKQFNGKKPLTTCKISQDGLSALKEYLDMVEEFSKYTK